MASISAAGHTIFLQALEDAITKFEKLKVNDCPSKAIVADLKHDLQSLEKLFTEFDSTISHLKNLASQYENTHRKARIDLRNYKHKYLLKNR